MNSSEQSSPDHGGLDAAEALAPVRPPTKLWLRRLDELKDFLATYGRYPQHQSAEPVEATLYRWLLTQRHAFLSRTLTWNQAAAMNVLGDWLTTDQELISDKQWHERFDELVAFHTQHGHLPSRRHFQSHEEDVLGIWWQTQVSTRNHGTMPAWRLEAMNEAFPGWAG